MPVRPSVKSCHYDVIGHSHFIIANQVMLLVSSDDVSAMSYGCRHQLSILCQGHRRLSTPLCQPAPLHQRDLVLVVRTAFRVRAGGMSVPARHIATITI